jgi:Ca-activated chloride channel family protein
MAFFDWPLMVIGALVGGVAAVFVVLAGFRRRVARMARLGTSPMVARLVPPRATRPPRARAMLLGGATLFALLALAGPRWGEERTIMRGEGIDIVLALDASLSMMATDERPNRLQRMIQEVRRLRADSRGDRFALLAFAGRSYILTPLTVDEGALDLFLENLDPSIVGQAGSSLAKTISQATDLLSATRSAGDRALVIMSDGEAFETIEEITEAARRAGRSGISVVTVGFGTAQGSTIPMRDGDRVVEKRDAEGNVVVTQYHPEFLRSAAEAAGGSFIDASESDKAAKIRNALQQLRGSTRSFESSTTRTARFQWFLLPAVLLVLLETWLSVARGRRRVPAAAAATTTAALVLMMSGCSLWNDYGVQGNAAYLTGQYMRAATLYRYALEHRDERPAIIYNYGTALLAADSLRAAAEPLERALRPEIPEQRFRALFNLGLIHLKRGLAGDPEADSTKQSLTAALEHYKRALIMRPGDVDAKWNYELALRKKEQSGGGGGGGGGGGSSNSDSEHDTPQNERPSGGLGQQQAEQLLNAAAREEKGVQGKRQQDNRTQRPRGAKDW